MSGQNSKVGVKKTPSKSEPVHSKPWLEYKKGNEINEKPVKITGKPSMVGKIH